MHEVLGKLVETMCALQRACVSRAALLTLMFGLAGSFAGFGLMWRSNVQKFEAEQTARIDGRVVTIATELARYEDVVASVQAFAEAHAGRMPIGVYQTYASRVLRFHSGILALDYMPRVSAAERAAFEMETRRQGFPEFRITEIGPDGRIEAAGVRHEYFPVYGLYPVEGNELALGLDARFARGALFDRVRDTGKTIASAPLRLVGKEDQWGVLLVGPIYATQNASSVAERRASLEGYALAVFRVGDLIEAILRQTEIRGYDHYIFDGTPDKAGPLLAVHSSRLRRPGELPPRLDQIDPSKVHTAMVRFHGRPWTIMTVSYSNAAAVLEADVVMVLVLGLLATGIGTFYVYSTCRRTAALNILTAELRKSDDWLRTIYESVSEGIFVNDPSTGVILEVNPPGWRMFGYPHDELIGRSIADLSSGQDGYTQETALEMLGALAPGRKQVFDWHCKAKDGHHFWAEISMLPAIFGSKTVALATVRDITDRREIQERLVEQARIDDLTRLPNRSVFVEALNQAMARARRAHGAFAMLYLDLDHFKDINDTLGHPIGDLLLVAVGERLRAQVRETDTVARFGGDEFAVLASDLAEPAEAAVLAGKLLQSLREPFSIGGNVIRSGASIGIAVFDRNAPTPEVLLSYADIALYRAKSDGRGTYRFFTDALDAEVRERVTLAEDLHGAIERGSLDLLFQPQVEIAEGSIVGVEALVRWRHPTRGELSPTQFIPVAERSGLMIPLGRWILEETCRQAKQWLDEGIAPATVAVNISAAQLKAAVDFEAAIDAALARTGLPARYLELELTETTLMETSLEHNDVLRRIHDRGIRLAIDDFGTGYSSLDYLRRFPVDRLKIAQTFVADITSDAGDVAIVKATIGLACELKINVIAEGVESAAQQDLLTGWGCHQVQGFYYSKPLASEKIKQVLRVGKLTPHGAPSLAVA